jgi:hypothetical protein
MTFGALVVLFVLVLIILSVNPQWSRTSRVSRPPAPPESYEVREAIARMCQESDGQFGRPITQDSIVQLRRLIPSVNPGDPATDLRLVGATMWLLNEGLITRGPANGIIGKLTKGATPSARERDLVSPW